MKHLAEVAGKRALVGQDLALPFRCSPPPCDAPALQHGAGLAIQAISGNGESDLAELGIIPFMSVGGGNPKSMFVDWRLKGQTAFLQRKWTKGEVQQPMR